LWFTGHSVSGVAVAELIVGGVVSTTVTVVEAVAVFPEPSFAVNVTVVVPSGNTAGALLTTVTTVQLSVAVGNGTVTGVPASAVCSTVIGAGTFEMIGG
jgi:hypothetical protein